MEGEVIDTGGGGRRRRVRSSLTHSRIVCGNLEASSAAADRPTERLLRGNVKSPLTNFGKTCGILVHRERIALWYELRIDLVLKEAKETVDKGIGQVAGMGMLGTKQVTYSRAFE